MSSEREAGGCRESEHRKIIVLSFLCLRTAYQNIVDDYEDDPSDHAQNDDNENRVFACLGLQVGQNLRALVSRRVELRVG